MKPRGSSRIKGYFRLSLEERHAILCDRLGIDPLSSPLANAISSSLVDTMIENSVGVMELPLGVATNFKINDFDVLVPMAIVLGFAAAKRLHARMSGMSPKRRSTGY